MFRGSFRQTHSLAPVDSDSAPAFDPTTFDTLRTSVDGDADFLAGLLDDYLDDAQEQLDTMRSAVDTDDRALLERSAHSLKSTSQTVGALALASVCTTIERLAHDGQLQDAAHRLAEAQIRFDAVKSTLRARKATFEAE